MLRKVTRFIDGGNCFSTITVDAVHADNLHVVFSKHLYSGVLKDIVLESLIQSQLFLQYYFVRKNAY